MLIGSYGEWLNPRFLTPSEFLLCAAESTCRLDCQVTFSFLQLASLPGGTSDSFSPQAKGHATGQCDGWACNCS